MALLEPDWRRPLLRRARAAIARAIGVEAGDTPPDAIPGDLHAGAFVTIRINGKLRGCIGYPESDLPLLEVVERCAASAAVSDPRFPSLSAAEWDDVDLELSVLGPIEPVADIAGIVVGRHGLIVESGRRRGLLLPQVAVEWKWNAAEFAAQTCIKAGLPRDAYQHGASLFKFEAEVFSESN
jgi:AmmeMemoRadiSam system protein A